MNKISNLKREIFNKVKKFYKLRKKGEKFIPGKTRIDYAGRVYNEKEMINLVDASLDFWLTAGRYAQQFEKEFAKFLGVKYCLLTNSGSSANLLAISALTSPKLGKKRLKPGDEVITAACGFPTTLNPILQNNLTPVFIDIDLGTYNIQVDKIEKAISKKTKAIFIAHTLGNPANLEKILKIVKKHNLWFIEDNCISGDRCSVIRLDGEIEIRTIKEIYDIFKCGKYKHFEILSNGEIFKQNDLKNLSNEFINTLSKRQLRILKLYQTHQGNSDKITTKLNISKSSYYCSMWEIRRKMRNFVGVKFQWAKVKNVVFKGIKEVRYITQNFGQTCVTNDHRIMVLNNGRLIDEYAIDFINKKNSFVNLLLTDNSKKKIVDLAAYLKGYTQKNGYIKYDNKWIWFEYNKNCWKGGISELPKLKRYYKGHDLKILCALFGFYCSEGSCGHELRFNSTNYSDIKFITKSIKSVSNLKTIRISYQNKRLPNVIRGGRFKSNKVVYSANMGHELINIIFSILGGTDSFNKKVPNFIFNLDKEYMEVFYNWYIKGDGCRKSKEEANFVITTASSKMAAGINLLNNLIFKKYSRFIISRDKYYDISPVKSLKYIKKKVVKVEKRKNAEVYDITVEGASTFTDACGNVLLHNCDALGSKYKGKYTGTFGHLATFSFYPAHQMSCLKNTPIPYLDENRRWKLNKIEKIYERYANKPNKIKILSFNKNNKIEWSTPSAILRHKLGSKKIVKIISQHGREVDVTEDHSIFVLDKDTATIIPKFAREIRKDNYLVATNNIPCPDEIKYIDILDYFRDKNAYVSDFSHSNLKYVKNADYRWQFQSRNTLPIKYLKEYNLETENLRIGISQSHKIPARIPINEELCRLIGYFIAEGSYQDGLVFSFNRNEKDLIDDVKNLSKTIFGIEAAINYIGNNAVNIEVQSKNVEIIFKETFKIEGGALKKRIPWFIYHSDESCIYSFIYGYTRGDGSIKKMKDNTNRIDVTSVSRELLNDFQYLLSRIGISASFYRRNTARKRKIGKYYADGKDNYSLCFSGYIYKNKSIVRSNTRDRNDVSLQIPLLSLFRKYICVSKSQKTISKNRLKKYLESNKKLYSLVNSDVCFLKVRSIQEVLHKEDEYVYDISVPGKENFYGGFLGLFLHNTMGEGGAVVTDNPLLKKIVASFRDWGRDCWCEPGHDNTCGKRLSQQFGKLPFGYDHKYVYSHIGYNLKITDMQAAVGVAQLKKLPSFIKARRKNFDELYKFFKNYQNYFLLPQPEKNSKPCWFGFPLLVRKTAPFTRNSIVQYLEDNKIATRMLFGGNLTKQPAYQNTKYRIFDSLKNTDLVMENLFWIGVYPRINKEMLKYIIKRFEEFFKKRPEKSKTNIWQRKN